MATVKKSIDVADIPAYFIVRDIRRMSYDVVVGEGRRDVVRCPPPRAGRPPAGPAGSNSAGSEEHCEQAD